MEGPSLDALPCTVLSVIVDHLIRINNGSPRDVVKLAVASKSLWRQMADPVVSSFWATQCLRLGWSLEWIPTSLGRERYAWIYFCRRMQCRWKLRRQLRTFKIFLDAQSAQALCPPAALECLEAAENYLKLPLPWESFELFRWSNGQEHRSGVQFLNGAGLLTVEEAAQQAKHEMPSEASCAEEFQAAVLQIWWEMEESISCEPSREAALEGRGENVAENTKRQLEKFQISNPQVLIPFTEELRGRKQYCMDLLGAVWLKSGFNVLPVAPSLAAFLHKELI